MNKVLISICIVSLAIASCNNQNTTDVEAEKERLLETSRQWSQKAQARNVDSIVAYWADDAIVLSSGEAPVQGKQAIRNMVESSFSNPGFSIAWEPERAEVSESGDMGYLIESTTMMYKDSLGASQTMKFKTVTVWKKQPDGSWKNVVDVMSPLPPAQ